MVREAAFAVLSQELPYALAVEVVEFDETRPDLTRIRAELLVERNSRKPIVVGRGVLHHARECGFKSWGRAF